MEKRNNNEQKKIDNVLYILGLSGAVICCVYLLISKITGFRIENYLYPCLFHTVTGYYCPGCGGTRAVCALFQGHFLISFLEHPFVPYAAVLCAWFLLSQTIERKNSGAKSATHEPSNHLLSPESPTKNSVLRKQHIIINPQRCTTFPHHIFNSTIVNVSEYHRIN